MSQKGPVFDQSRAVLQLNTERLIVGPFYKWSRGVSVTGQENIPAQPVVLAANHLSLWDPPLLSIATKKPICYVAKQELFQNVYLGMLIELLGAVSIDRQKPSLSSIKKIKEAIKAGWSLGIFVEGTRSKIANTLGSPHTGAAFFAHANKLPILPVGIIGTNQKKSECIVRIGKAIEPGKDLEGKTGEIMQSLSELTGFKLPDNSSKS